MIVGIDLGTTNSLIAIYGENGVELVPNALGDLLTPSAVSLDDKGAVLVGRAARDRLVTHPLRSAASFKRLMGSSRELGLGDRRFRAEELSALVLRSLIADAEAYTCRKVEEAVISVPAYFGDAQRKATRAAGELAGIRVERLVNEPTAAALAYGLEARADGTSFIVLDLGGGTFDVSILEVFEGVMRVHASAGDNRLGGDDFVRLLYEEAQRELGLRDAGMKPEERAQLAGAMEKLKVLLSTAQEAQVQFLAGGEMKSFAISEDRFARLADPLFQRIRRPIERAMRDARITVEDLSEVVLVGGASRMPGVARLATRMFGRLPLRHVSPDEAIARGAGVAAGLKARAQALEEIVLTDVCPYTMGVGVAITDERGEHTEGHFSPIIERNLTVPVSRAEVYYPVEDRQRVIELEVFQGESPFTANNVLLGKLRVKLPSGLSRPEAGVEVRFTYDVNGVLQVEAKVQKTGEVSELILHGDNEALDMAEVRRRLKELAKLKVHPREAQENLATLARAERAYEESLGDHRTFLQAWIARFKSVVESQDPDAIAAARVEFEAMLAEFEKSRG